MPISDIITGQFVCIEQTPATIGERLLARIIDSVVLMVYFYGVIKLLDSTANAIDSDVLRFAYIIIVFLPMLMYPFLSELMFGGRTLGKYAMHIQVVMADGSSPTLGALFMRYVCEMVDIGFCGVGLIFILCTKHHQRLGDLAAGTMVIRHRDTGHMHVSLDEFAYARRGYSPAFEAAAKLSPRQADVISRALTFAERSSSGFEQLDALANKVGAALKIAKQGGKWTAIDTDSSWTLLNTVLNDYKYFKANM